MRAEDLIRRHGVTSTTPGERPGLGPWRSPSPPAGFAPFPDDAVASSVTERFLRIAEIHADATALSSPAGTWTYAAMAATVRRGGAAIAGLVGSDSPTPVAVVADHDGPLVIAIMSVIASGHVVVVLDATAPPDAVDHVVMESGTPLLLHDDATADLSLGIAARAGGLRTASLSDLVASTSGADRELPERGPDDPLMLAFTSGTSGSPKGAVITHGVILNLVRGATDALGITADDRMPMLFPASLAVAAYPMFIPLLNGAALATLDVRGVGLAPVAEFLVRERITLAYMAPTVIRFLVDAVAGYDFPDLRMIALGGEVVDAEVVRLTAELFSPERMANGFGTTETGVITLYVIDPDAPPEGAVPSGYPVPDVELEVLDHLGRPVSSPGESGEIAVVSPHVFQGYWGHAELNRQVLSDDPAGRPGWKLYRTGDLGRLDEHGALVVLGRLDTKVKVRGRFVVLGDVEAALHELDEVADAAVVATTREDQVELCAVVVPSAGSEPEPTALRAALLERHEPYRVPSRWVLVEDLPRLPNGKVDRRALPVGEPSSSAAAAPRAPEDDAGVERPELAGLQREIRDLWELLLPVGVVGLDDDFVELGGDSLLAAQMLVMAEQRTGITVPMGELIRARTVRDLAAVMLDLDGSADRSTASCVQTGDESARPRLWFVHDLQGSAYRVRHLARHLGPDQPVWSFESPLLAGEPNRFTSLDTFAANYVADLLAAQPEGPYWLGGYSFGGICAFEMARQMRRDGHEVAFLGVVDVGPGYRGPNWSERRIPFRPWFGVEKPPPEGSTAAQQVAHYRDMALRSRVGLARHAMVRSGLYRVVDPVRFRADIWAHGRVRPEWRLWYAWEEHWKLGVRSWDRTRRYDGRMDLMWASRTGSTDNSLGWGAYVPDLHIHRFDGFHDHLLEEKDSPRLGAALRAVLDDRIAGT
jgi:acyl-coenzyme A synthetase/AMP-(fatty) acid ligase/thioesterase domain-containing protein/acyl carrier protein